MQNFSTLSSLMHLHCDLAKIRLPYFIVSYLFSEKEVTLYNLATHIIASGLIFHTAVKARLTRKMITLR